MIDVKRAAAALGWDYKTLRNALTVARSVPPGGRSEGLSWTHHREAPPPAGPEQAEAVELKLSEQRKFVLWHDAQEKARGGAAKPVPGLKRVSVNQIA